MRLQASRRPSLSQARSASRVWPGPIVAYISAADRPSCAWPAVSFSRIGRPGASTRAWILVVRPPRARPMQSDRPAFFDPWRRADAPGSRSYRSSGCHPRKPLTPLAECAPDAPPAAGGRSGSRKARMGPVARRNICPRRPRPQTPEYPVQDLPVIGALHPTHLGRQQRLDHTPFKIRQIKACHQKALLPSGSESQHLNQGNPLYGYVT